MLCRSCKRELVPSANFCSNCGTPCSLESSTRYDSKRNSNIPITSPSYQRQGPETVVKKTYRQDGTLLFEGEFNGQIRHGHGKLYRQDETLVLEGDFIDGELAKGKQYYQDGSLLYEGGFKDSKWHGKGKYYDEHGNLAHDGEFNLGNPLTELNMAPTTRPKRKSRLSITRNRVYYVSLPGKNGLGLEGDFRKNGATGYGQKWAIDQSYLMYEGELQDGQYHGQGTQYGANRYVTYEGEFKDNYRSGQGKYYYPNGGTLSYEGEFLWDFSNGYGRSYREDRTLEYEGLFGNGERGHPHGKGHGKPHGKGKSYYPNGITLQYEGFFQDGNYHGKGELYRPDGSLQCEGEFEEGNLFKGKIYDDDSGNIKYEGRFENGILVKGKIYDSEGTLVSDGHYKNGDLINGKQYHENNRLAYEGEFKHEKRDGQGKSYRVDGSLLYEGEFKDGREHGQGTEFWSNGRYHYVGGWKNGNPDGQGREWYDPIGESSQEGEWFICQAGYPAIRYGKLYDPTGLYYEGEIAVNGGRATGQGKLYDPHVEDYDRDGLILKYEGEVKDLVRNGQGKNYDYDGNVDEEGEWVNNKLHEGKKYLYWRDIKDNSSNGTPPYKSILEVKHGESVRQVKTYHPNGRLAYEGEYLRVMPQDYRNYEEWPPNGKGRYYNLDGSYYEGEFDSSSYHENDRHTAWSMTSLKYEEYRHGQGKEYGADQTLKYEGEFKHGKRDGQGKEYDYDRGVERQGEWVNGNLYEGKEYDANQTLKYEGEFKHGKRDGQGKEYGADQTLKYEGEWRNGVRYGHEITSPSNKSLMDKDESSDLDLVDVPKSKDLAHWPKLIQTAIANLGGQANLSDIYGEIKKLNPDVSRTFDATVRRTLQQYNSASSIYLGKGDLFAKVNKQQDGLWRLRTNSYEVVSDQKSLTTSSENPIPLLEQFLTQSHLQGAAVNLKTRHYPRQYSGLNMKVSFGQGREAKVSWIGFFGDGMSISKGFYPVYLYYKDRKTLILAYGISETFEYELSWDKDIINNHKKIQDYLPWEVPRYGDSYVFRSYEVNQEGEIIVFSDPANNQAVTPDQIISDLNLILSEYKSQLGVESNLNNLQPNDVVDPYSIPSQWETVEEYGTTQISDDQSLQNIISDIDLEQLSKITSDIFYNFPIVRMETIAASARHHVTELSDMGNEELLYTLEHSGIVKQIPATEDEQKLYDVYVTSGLKTTGDSPILQIISRNPEVLDIFHDFIYCDLNPEEPKSIYTLFRYSANYNSPVAYENKLGQLIFKDLFHKYNQGWGITNFTVTTDSETTSAPITESLNYLLLTILSQNDSPLSIIGLYAILEKSQPGAKARQVYDYLLKSTSEFSCSVSVSNNPNPSKESSGEIIFDPNFIAQLLDNYLKNYLDLDDLIIATLERCEGTINLDDLWQEVKSQFPVWKNRLRKRLDWMSKKTQIEYDKTNALYCQTSISTLNPKYIQIEQLFLQEKYKDVVTAGRALLRNDPTMHEVYYIRGLACKRLGELNLAISDFSRYLESVPPHRTRGYIEALLAECKGGE